MYRFHYGADLARDTREPKDSVRSAYTRRQDRRVRGFTSIETW